jgi:tryptophan synthase alpha chain
VCVGFGISTAEHVRAICEIADGAIVGSAIVRRIEEGVADGCPSEEIVERVRTYVAELLEATVAV